MRMRFYNPSACATSSAATAAEILPSDTAAFAVEIRYYARQIPLPEELWRRMLQPSSAPAAAAELESESNAVTAAILTFLREQR